MGSQTHYNLSLPLEHKCSIPEAGLRISRVDEVSLQQGCQETVMTATLYSFVALVFFEMGITGTTMRVLCILMFM